MLLFSTLLPARQDLKADVFFEAILDWNSRVRLENRVEGAVWKKEKSIRWVFENRELILDSLVEEGLYGARFVKTEGGIHWRTDVLYFQQTAQILIQLDRSYFQQAAGFQEQFSTPFVIAVMMDHALFAAPEGIPFQTRPWRIRVDCKNEMASLKNLLEEKNTSPLPVVLMQKKAAEPCRVDEEALAWRLKGAAFVVVLEEGNSGLENPFFETGSISVHYPKGKEGFEVFEPKPGEDRKSVAESLCERIFCYHLQLESASLSGWMMLKARRLERSLIDQTRLQQENEQEMNALFEEMEGDLDILSRQIQALQAENTAMHCTLQGFYSSRKTGNESGSAGLQEFYPGEINDMLVQACKLYEKHCHPGGRMESLVQAWLKNHACSAERQRRMDCIEETFGKGSVERRRLIKLEEAGFEVSEDGPHYKLIYEKDRRYTFSVSRTPSDYRAMKNSLSVILSRLFR